MVMAMNDYCRGVLEALGWVLELLDGVRDMEGLETVKRRIRTAIEELVRGSGSSLADKLGVIEWR